MNSPTKVNFWTQPDFACLVKSPAWADVIADDVTAQTGPSEAVRMGVSGLHGGVGALPMLLPVARPAPGGVTRRTLQREAGDD